MPDHSISKIVSGGQTGVDRAALDVAMFLDIPHGGWCPLGRRSEDGPIPQQYELAETRQRDYSVRTEKNVVDSDGTLILYRKRMSGGTELTHRLARKHRRPFLCIDVDAETRSQSDTPESVIRWLGQKNIRTVNVAGPRESTSPGISRIAESFLIRAFETGATRLPHP